MTDILANNEKVEYTIKRSARAKYVRLAVRSDASVLVTLPFGVNEQVAEKFVRAKAVWLIGKIAHFKQRADLTLPGGSWNSYLRNKFAALTHVKERVRYFNQFYNYKFAKISVKNQRTRWGSCSRRGNLNYNFKIFFLPGHLADYVIVHELCHLQEFNHGKNFWSLVGKTIPEYKKIIKEIRGVKM